MNYKENILLITHYVNFAIVYKYLPTSAWIISLPLHIFSILMIVTQFYYQNFYKCELIHSNIFVKNL